MGYYSRFELEITRVDLEECDTWGLMYMLRESYYEASLAFTESGESGDTVKWYNHIKDFKKFSAENPEYVFILTRVGEDHPDFERTYFYNGKNKSVKGSIIYPVITVEELEGGA